MDYAYRRDDLGKASGKNDSITWNTVNKDSTVDISTL